MVRDTIWTDTGSRTSDPETAIRGPGSADLHEGDTSREGRNALGSSDVTNAGHRVIDATHPLETPSGVIWETKDGRKIPITEMTDVHLVNVLRFLQRQAEDKRRFACTIATLLDIEVLELTWEFFAHEKLESLAQEAERRGLEWKLDIDPLDFEEIAIDGTRRGTLEGRLTGALRDAINAHGSITWATAPSAAKRMIGVLKDHNRGVDQEKRIRKQKCEELL